jgi:hypothetical protein
MALAVVDEKNRPKTPFAGREMRGQRWLNMHSKVSNRNGSFVGIEGVSVILGAPFVSNRKTGLPADFGDFEELSVWKAGAGASATRRMPKWEKVMRGCEAP